MPAPMTDNLEDIKNGEEMVLWLDEKQNSKCSAFLYVTAKCIFEKESTITCIVDLDKNGQHL